MSYTVVWTETALQRVEEIGDYIALDRPATARKMVERLFGAVKGVAGLPRTAPRFRLSENENDRRLVVAPYVVFFRIDDSQSVIVVLTVRHERERNEPVDADE